MVGYALRETGQTVSRAMATGRPPGSAVERVNPFESVLTVKRVQKKKGKRGTSSHFTCVIYNALVVLVGSMGEIHTNCNVDESDHGGIDIGIRHTDVDTSPSKLSKLLGSVNLRP